MSSESSLTDSPPETPATVDGTNQNASPVSSGRVQAWQIAGILLLLAILGLSLYGLWPTITGETGDDPAQKDVEAPTSEAEVDVVVAQRGDFPLRTRASGHLTPWREAVLRAEASGTVVERAVDEGDRVAQGGLLARLENREEQIALEEARAQLLKARAEFQAKYAGSPAASEGGTSENSSSPSSSSNDRRATQAAVSGLTEARQAVERAELNLDRTQVTAPFAGRVANLEVEEGQYVSQGNEVATLLQDSRMKVETDVLEGDLVHVEKGTTARVDVPALGSQDDSTAWVHGTVWAVNPQVERESGTGRVTVSIPNPEGRLVSGLHAEAQLETERLQDRLVVPDEAVLVRQGRDLVFVIEDGRAQWSYVELGARSGDRVEITDGVTAGDTIAVDGHFALAHDAPVRVDEVRDPVLE